MMHLSVGICLLNYSLSNGYEVVLHVICTTLVINDDKYLFMNVLAIHSSSLVKNIFKSFAHLKTVLFFLTIEL